MQPATFVQQFNTLALLVGGRLALNVVAALFVGFTFFKAKSSIQGTQNKIFVSCLLSAH